MFSSLEVKKDIFWVGALDYNIRIFDIVMYTKYGTTYNSFVVKGTEKTVLFEISKDTFFDEHLERIQSVCDISKIDYIVVSHTEPDHTGALAKILKLNPNITIVGTAVAIKFLSEITNMEFKSMSVKDGDTLNIGDKTIRFIMAPFLHWPDTMYSYIEESKTIFTCDSFGCHYCDEHVFNDKIEHEFIDAYKYYFDVILSPFSSFVLDALHKIKDLDIETICTGHGPVIRTDVQKYLDLYKEWATPVKRDKPSVVIPYVTSYMYTKKMAEKISEGIKSVGDIDVCLFDLVDSKKEDVLHEIKLADGVLFGSPTLVGDTLPPIWEILSEMNPIIHRGKLTGAFGSYGWSGEAVPNIEQRLKQLKLKMPAGTLKILFNPSNEQLNDCFEYGKVFGEAIIK